MKLTIKVALIVSLFTSVAFADDGDMGNGGFAAGDMGNGGRTCVEKCTTGVAASEGEASTDESILSFISEYLDSLFS